MRRTAVTRAAVVAVTACLASTACGAAGGDGAAGPAGGGTDVAYISPIASQPGQVLLTAGLQGAGEELGWNVEVYDANLSTSTQVSNVQTVIQQQKAALGLWPLDSGALQGSFAQAAAAGIPVAAVNTTAPGIDKTVYWETNTCVDGSPYLLDAARIATLYPGGNVIVMGGPPVPSIQANVACFTEAAEAAGLTVLTQSDNTDDSSAGGAQLAADLLTKYPEVDAFWAYNDSTALGVSSAVIAAGGTVQSGTSPDGVYIQGTNGDDDAIAAVQQGRLSGTWDTNPVATGWAVIRAMRDFMASNDSSQLTVEADWYDAGTVGTYVAPAERTYTLDSVPLVPALP